MAERPASVLNGGSSGRRARLRRLTYQTHSVSVMVTVPASVPAVRAAVADGVVEGVADVAQPTGREVA